MSRIMLINPPFYRFMGSHNNDSRLGLGYLSAILRRAGHEVAQYNADYMDEHEYASQVRLFNESEAFFDNIRMPNNPVYTEVYKTILGYKPDIVGITVMAGTLVQSEIIANFCANHNIRVIVGGTMVTLALAEMVQNSDFHQLIPGEGEKVIVQAIAHPERRIMVGMNTANLDTLPFPDRDNFIVGNDRMAHGSVASARGCTFRCKYCSNSILGGEVRFRSIKNVVDEIEQIVSRFGQTDFRFFDDTFTVNKKRVLEFSNEVKNRNLKITFLVETRVDCLDLDTILALKSAGMTRAKLGIESGSEKILKIYKPQYNKDAIRNVVRILKENDINPSLNWMFGFPEETDADLRDSIDFALELAGSWNTISSLAPYYGTDLFDELPEAERKNWRGFYHTMKKPVMNPDLSENLINEFLDINNKLGLCR